MIPQYIFWLKKLQRFVIGVEKIMKKIYEFHWNIKKKILYCFQNGSWNISFVQKHIDEVAENLYFL